MGVAVITPHHLLAELPLSLAGLRRPPPPRGPSSSRSKRSRGEQLTGPALQGGLIALQGLTELFLALHQHLAAPLQHPARLPPRSRGHHQTAGLQVAQPFLVGLELGVGYRGEAGHGSGVGWAEHPRIATVKPALGAQHDAPDPLAWTS